jgi:hypothetical protein
VDGASSPLANVQVSGNWSNGANGAGSCTTGASGSCQLVKQNLKGNVASVDYTVTDLVADGYNYEPAANEVPNTVTVFKVDPNLLPVATDDMFSTPVDTVLNANVLANDDPGDAPATVTSFDVASAQGFAVSVAANGDFSYTPTGAFEGNDSFDYAITDNNGDSDAATVNITVGNPPALREVTTVPFKVKGVHHVEVFWSGFQAADVDIRRDGGPTVTVANAEGSWVDETIGAKGGGVTYSYEVCEAGSTTECASASASF